MSIMAAAAAFARLSARRRVATLLDCRIDDPRIEVSPRMVRAIKHASGYYASMTGWRRGASPKLQQVFRLTDRELLQIKSVGRAGVAEIRAYQKRLVG